MTCSVSTSDGFKLTEVGLDQEEILHREGAETLEHVTPRSCRSPIPGTVQGQIGCGFEQPGLVKDLTQTIL